MGDKIKPLRYFVIRAFNLLIFKLQKESEHSKLSIKLIKLLNALVISHKLLKYQSAVTVVQQLSLETTEKSLVL